MSEDSKKFTWIRTQDGSPTLWNNDLGEPFRSVKGAFRESLLVFAKPAIEYIQKNNLKDVVVGEFGLGLGTNWFIFSMLADYYEIPHTYFSIERDVEPFNLAMPRWEAEAGNVSKLFKDELGIDTFTSPSTSELPIIYPAVSDIPPAMKANIWFHDPFGFSVNPEGYSTEILEACSKHWSEKFLGLSYACNTQFQKVLTQVGIPNVKCIATGSPPLKKERLEFNR